MPIFKKLNSKQYILTNYKVMYSTLYQQQNLSMVRMDSVMKYDILLNWLFLSPSKFYFISRNPYDRTASFFKDKFRNAVDYYDRKGYWQTSQILFFPYLGITELMSPEAVKQRLLSTTFEEIVAILPKVYMKDKHLRPQWYMKTIKKKKNWTVHIRIVKVFKMESVEDLAKLQAIFKIDFSAKVNSTSSVDEKLEWSETVFRTVDILYEKDFKYFNYEKNKVNL